MLFIMHPACIDDRAATKEAKTPGLFMSQTAGALHVPSSLDAFRVSATIGLECS